MWTPATRAQHSRKGLRYPTDLTDAEWQVTRPLLPPPGSMGRPRKWPMREGLNAIFYVLRTGCPSFAWHGGGPAEERPARGHRAFLVPPVPRRSGVRTHGACFGLGRPRASGPRGQPVGGGHGQPVREDRRERRAARLSLPRPPSRGRRKEDRRSQAARPRGHSLPRTLIRGQAARDAGRTCKRTGSRRSRAACGCLSLTLPLRGPRLRRRRLPGTTRPQSLSRADPNRQGRARPVPLRRPARRWVVERTFAWLGRNRRLWKDAEATTASATACL